MTQDLYDRDFVEWAAQTAELLRQGRVDQVDLEQVAEEIEDLGKSDLAAVEAYLQLMLMHLVKRRIQPERAGSNWQRSITTGRIQIDVRIQHSPSLLGHLERNLQKIYRRAVRDALRETGLLQKAHELDIPQECPYTVHDLLERDDL
jgi:Domain of unknown function DUF29